MPNKTSKYVWTTQYKVGTSYITIADTVNGAPAGDVCTMTDHESLIANDLAGYQMIGITGDNIGTVFTVVSNTAADPTLVTLSGTPATPADLAGDEVSFQLAYEFGKYNDECGKWNSPFVENPAIPSWVYATPTPTLTDVETKYPTFSHVFLPVSAQFLAWFLAEPADSDPEVLITALAAKMTYPLTIRHELIGGTAPQNKQAVDCYCVGLTIKMERSTKLIVEPIFAWGALESISSSNPNLTRAPIAPAELMTEVYNGNPDVLWNATPMTGVWRADIKLEREHDKVSGDGGAVQTVHVGKIMPVKILLSAVLKQNTTWDDYVGRNARTMVITVLKFDDTSYIELTFTNAKVISVKETGDRNEGHHGAVMALIAEKVEGEADWFTEGGTDFGTHWKAALP